MSINTDLSLRKPHVSPPLESIEGTASRQASNTLAIITSPGSEALDHKSSNPKLAMSEDSAQLPYGGKLRSMIRKVLPRSKKDGNGHGSLRETLAGPPISREHLGCEVVHEDEGDIRAEYVPDTLGEIYAQCQYSPDNPV